MTKTILITIGISMGFTGGVLITQTQGADLVAKECPVCNQIITAKSIKQNVLDYSGQRFESMTKIKLPDIGSYEIEIGKDLYTKDQLKLIK